MATDRQLWLKQFARVGYITGAAISLVLFYILLPQLISRYHYQQGVEHSEKKQS